MSRIVVCLDCPHYQTGGYCRLKHKDVGALNPACDQADKEGKADAPHRQAGEDLQQVRKDPAD